MFFEDPVFWKCAYIWKTSEEKVSKNTVRTSMRKTCKNHPKNDQKTHQKSSKNKPKKHTEKLTTQFQPRGRKRCPKIGRQGGKGGIQDGILLEKKKEYCKNQTYCGERVHAGRKHADCDRIPTRPCGGPHTARGRISVACGNSSAPGPREDSLHAKICKKFDTRVNAGVFFYKFLP